MVNVRVVGKNSNRHYNVALQVQEPDKVKEKDEELEITDLTTHTELVKETETTREVTEKEEGGKTIIHEIIHTIEKLVERQVAELEIRSKKLIMGEKQVKVIRGRIAKDTYVRWINKDRANRTIKSIEVPDENENFNSGRLVQDQKYQFKFEVVGTYKYVIDTDQNSIYEIIVE